MNTVSDEDLVIAARCGDGKAFAVLVERYSTAVRTVAFHVVRDYHHSQDIAQETFVLGFKQLNSLRIGSLFGRWILKIARNQSIRMGMSRRSDLPLQHAMEVASSEPEGTDFGYLMSEIMRLPEREQRLVMLRYFGGNSIQQIARITGSPVGTITKQLSRGYTRLRERLSEALI